MESQVASTQDATQVQEHPTDGILSHQESHSDNGRHDRRQARADKDQSSAIFEGGLRKVGLRAVLCVAGLRFTVSSEQE